MILKFKPIRKGGRSLLRTLEYVANDKGKIEDYRTKSIFHNVQSIDLKDIEKEYQDNFNGYASNRYKNIGIHLIASINPIDREKVSPEIMDDILGQFLSDTYPDAFAFGTHHTSQKHFHSHLVISSNRIASERSTRLSKQELREAHERLQGYIREKYPDLTLFDMKEYGKKLNKETEYYQKKRNPEVILDRESLTKQVQNIFRGSENSQVFFEDLKSEGLRTYTHKDQVFGIWYKNDKGEDRKMRFSRLGVSQEHIKELDAQEKELESRLAELEESKARGQERGNERSQNRNDRNDDERIEQSRER